MGMEAIAGLSFHNIHTLFSVELIVMNWFDLII